MTKNDLVDSVQAATKIPKIEATEIVDLVFELMKETLERGEKIKISGFGLFEIHDKHARRGRNPQSGEAMEIRARKVLSFKASQLLRDALIQNKI